MHAEATGACPACSAGPCSHHCRALLTACSPGHAQVHNPPTPDPPLCRSLQRKDGSFAPAWQLADGRLERAGRSSKPGHKPVPTPGMTLTAGLVIVGDEILSAKVPDTNTSFLCKELRAIGWRVCKVGWAAVRLDSARAELFSIQMMGGVCGHKDPSLLWGAGPTDSTAWAPRVSAA